MPRGRYGNCLCRAQGDISPSVHAWSGRPREKFDLTPTSWRLHTGETRSPKTEAPTKNPPAAKATSGVEGNFRAVVAQAALDFPIWAAIASINGGFKQS